jgi:RNA polymerase sigma-70 factor (ECF subfamily)
MDPRDLTMSTIERAQAGLAASDEAFSMDDETFRIFYDRTARALWAYLSRASGSRTLADDLLQESYVRLLQAKLVSSDEAYLKNYLFRIGGNLLRDHWRRERSAPRASETEDATTTPDPSAEIGRRSDVAGALLHLKPRERQLLWLAYVEGASHREIAAVAGLRETSIRPLLFRARQRMARILERTGLRP